MILVQLEHTGAVEIGDFEFNLVASEKLQQWRLEIRDDLAYSLTFMTTKVRSSC